MTRANRAIIKKAIADSNLNGFKWTVTKDGLRWSYLDVEFNLNTNEDRVKFTCEEGVKSIVFIAHDNVDLLVNGDHDFESNFEDALYWATRGIIKAANHLF